MAGSSTMASFASLFGRAATFIERGFPVRGFLEIVVDILMTGLASLRAGVFSRLLGCGHLVLSIRDAYKHGED